MYLVDISNEILHMKVYSCSCYTAFTKLLYITPLLKLHNNGPINVSVKRCRCPCSLLVWNGISIVFNDCFQLVRHRTDKILKC